MTALTCASCAVDHVLGECLQSPRRDGGTFYRCPDCEGALAVLLPPIKEGPAVLQVIRNV